MRACPHSSPSRPPRALHGCGMVCMVSWGPNHSKTILETERMLVSRTANCLPHTSTKPSPSRLFPEKGLQDSVTDQGALC